MFIDNGCDYILVGHSEIRLANTKFEATNDLSASIGLQAIFCVGENEDAKKTENTKIVLGKQLDDLCSKFNHTVVNPEKTIIAYEPVWSIGTGNIPNLEDISSIHKFIKTYVSENHPFAKEKDIMVLFGGSVNSKNAKDILSSPNVDGVLIGGSSLDVKEFTKICNLKI